jgi:hypothetical protein
MNNSIRLLLLLIATVFMNNAAIADAIIAVNGIASSNKTLTMIKVVRHKKSDKDPLSPYGAGFYIMIFNKSDKPINISPDDIVVKNANGQILSILTNERLAAIREQQAKNSQMMGAMFGMAMGMMSNSAAAHMPNAAAANNMVAMGQMDAMAMASIADASAAGIRAGTGSLEAEYDSTPFSPTTLPPLKAAGGRVIIEGIKDKNPVSVTVTIAGEVHEITFAKS